MEEFDFSIIMTGKLNLSCSEDAPDDMEFEELFKNGYIKIKSAELTIKGELGDDVVLYDELNPEAGELIRKIIDMLVDRNGGVGLN